MRSYLPAVVDASRAAEFPVTGTPAGTVVVRAAGLRVHGGTVTRAGRGAVGGRAGGVLPPGGDGPGGGPPGRDGAGGRVAAGPGAAGRAGAPPRRRRDRGDRGRGDRGGAAEAAAAAADDVVSAGHPADDRDDPDAGRVVLRGLARLAGLLADIPFTREWHVPTEKVVTDWRLPVPPDVMEGIFWQAAGPLIGDGEPSAVLLAGMMVLAADGMLVNLADTPANRALFGSTGTAR